MNPTADTMRADAPKLRTRHKILHVIDTLEIGGAEQSLLQMCRLMDRNRFEPVVCSVYAGSSLQAAFEAEGVRVHAIGLRRKYQFVNACRRLARIVAEEQPSLMHTTLFRANQVGRCVGRLYRVPVISSLVNTSYDPVRLVDNPFLSPFKLGALRRLDAWTARWVTGFHAVSEEVRRSNCRYLGIPADRVSVIYRGRDPADFEAPPGAEVGETTHALGLDQAHPVLLNVGRLIDQKGQKYLVEAMSYVVEEFPLAQLLIAGEGWMRSRLEDMISELGLAGHVRLLGGRNDVHVLLRLADCFVFPSIHEGMPGAVIEAMLSRRPVVASDLPMIRELIDDGITGILVRPQDPRDLARGVGEVVRDPQVAARLGTAACRAAQERFDIKQIVKQTEELFSRIIAGCRPRR